MVLADLLPLPGWAALGRRRRSLALGASLAVAAGSDLAAGVALTAGAGAAVVAAGSPPWSRDRVPAPHPVLPAVLPALLVAPVVYLLARVLVG